MGASAGQDSTRRSVQNARCLPRRAGAEVRAAARRRGDGGATARRMPASGGRAGRGERVGPRGGLGGGARGVRRARERRRGKACSVSIWRQKQGEAHATTPARRVCGDDGGAHAGARMAALAACVGMHWQLRNASKARQSKRTGSKQAMGPCTCCHGVAARAQRRCAAPCVARRGGGAAGCAWRHLVEKASKMCGTRALLAAPVVRSENLRSERMHACMRNDLFCLFLYPFPCTCMRR